MKTRHVETALIIGGGSGMGEAISQKLAESGISVSIADLNLQAAEASADRIRQAGGTAGAFQVDISSSDSVAALFNQLKERTERLDMMINTAAVLGKVSFIEDMTDEEWRKVISINLDGVFYSCRESVRWMKAHQSGRIVLFSSVASQIPSPGSIHYSSAKGGVNMLGRTLAKEAAKYNIRVNMIAPGYINTPMLADMPDGFVDFVVRKTPLKRLGETAEIAALVAFLASPEADFFTGQVIGPNGGWVI